VADPVLLVGAGLGTTAAGLWGRCASQVEGIEVLGIDLPGHGPAAPVTSAVSVASLASAVRARADALEGRPVWYAGVSLAGAVGLTLALDPGPVRGVAVLAAASRIGEPQSWLERAELVRREGTAAMVAGSSERWFAPGFAARDPDTVDLMLRELTEVDAESYASCCTALASYDVHDEVAHAKVPVLLGRGDLDVVVSADVWAHDASTLPDVTTWVFAGCGHQPPAEDPTRVAELLTTWIHEGAS
jgi:pimeloyl-ACP methyl ester carboxylesterase